MKEVTMKFWLIITICIAIAVFIFKVIGNSGYFELVRAIKHYDAEQTEEIDYRDDY